MSVPQVIEPVVLDHRFVAMATPITMRVLEPALNADALIRSAEALVRAVDRSCTRFDERSELSRVNIDPTAWHDVSPIFAAAVTAAELGAVETAGRVDPRVLEDLEELGYSVTFDRVELDGPPPRTARISRQPRRLFHAEHRPGQLRLDGHRIDLGGVAKGLAVDRAVALLSDAGSGALVEAGGDLAVVGAGPDAGAWNIDVEDPLGRGLERDAVAVLSVENAAVATSSVRHRSWRRGGQPVHHLIDPLTGLSADTGLAAVTVVADSAVAAERWTKALFLAGSAAIRDEAESRRIAALWVDGTGSLSWSSALDAHLIWRSPHVPLG